MILFLARHEWRLLSASTIVLLALTVFTVMLAAASLVGVNRHARDAALVTIHERRGELQRAIPVPLRADLVGNERGWIALLPPAPLSALAVGQGDVYSNYMTVTARSLESLVTGDQIEHPLAVASGQFDVAFVVLFLYPLLIFAISFDLTASERDRGTLRLVLSQPVRLRDVVAGKMIARVLLLALPVVVVPFVVAAPVVSGFGRMTIWTLAVLAYGLVWHGLAFVVNARGFSAAANALVLAAIWLLFAVVGPSAINLLIAVRYPMPSRVEAAVQARAAAGDATRQGSQQLGQFLQDHPTVANVGREGMKQFALLQAARDQQVADRLRAVAQSYESQLQRQQRLASWLSVLSPTMIAQGVLLDVAGTSAHRFEQFRAQAAVFQQQWRAYFEPRVLDARMVSAAEYAAAPSFVFMDAPASDTVRRTAAPIAAMAAAGVLLLWAGVRGYRGYAP